MFIYTDYANVWLMNLGMTGTANLLGTSNQTSAASNPSVYDLVTGKASSSIGVLQSTYLGQPEPSLTSTQSASIEGLTEYVNEYVEDSPQKEALLESINALEKLVSSGNAQNPGVIDPAFALLAGNPLALGQGSADAGILIDQLI